jgi:predicted RNA-binding protein with PUA-like domain
MKYWLVKTEPGTWSWTDQKKQNVTHWDGVRNYQAANNLKAMQVGDQCFFYHSVSEKCIVGIVEVVKTAYPDPTDETGRFVMVDVKYLKELIKPVSLESIKNDSRLSNIALVKQSRLSVMPISADEWKVILEHSL